MNGQAVVLRSEASRDLACSIILRAPPGSVAQITAPRRSVDQNAKMHAMLSDVSRAKPEGRVLPPEIWKAVFMASVGHQCRFEPSLDGKGVVPVGFKSSRLNKGEFSDLIEAIYSFGAEHGVEWSEPQTTESHHG